MLFSGCAQIVEPAQRAMIWLTLVTSGLFSIKSKKFWVWAERKKRVNSQGWDEQKNKYRQMDHVLRRWSIDTLSINFKNVFLRCFSSENSWNYSAREIGKPHFSHLIAFVPLSSCISRRVVMAYNRNILCRWVDRGYPAFRILTTYPNRCVQYFEQYQWRNNQIEYNKRVD